MCLSNSYSLTCYFDLRRRMIPAMWTKPVSQWLLLDTYTVPVEPLIRTIVVVARYHIAEVDALAYAVLGVIRP
jgi:hypothetical protein